MVPVTVSALLGPVVVITGNLQPEDHAALGAVGTHSALPVLIVVAEHAQLDAVRTAGWRAAHLRPGADVALAWDDAMEQGYARVGR